MQKNALEKQIQRAKARVRVDTVGTITDEMKNHPDWVRDAEMKKFTLLEKAIKEKHQKTIQEEIDRREKLRPKKIRV